jgi:Ser/Thr protein kinase RdoA (MazF antagonist)
MRDFASLTMNGRAGRLRRLALKALESWDLDVTRLSLLSNWTNCIFRVDISGGGRVVLRICEPSCCHGEHEIAAEVSWMAALDRDTDIGLCAPIPARNGELAVLAEVEGVPEPRYCMLQTWVPGVDLNERIDPSNYADLGEIVARLHVHAETFSLPEGVRLRALDRVFPWSAPGFEHYERIVLFDPDNAHLFPGGRLGLFYRAIDRAQEEIDRIYREGKGPRILHQDLHPWNVRICRGRLYLLDFEDLIMGYPVQDVATALFYVRFGRPDSGELTAGFREGYERILPWPEEHVGQLDLLMAARNLLLANFLLSQENPEARLNAAGYLEKTEIRLRELIPELTDD